MKKNSFYKLPKVLPLMPKCFIACFWIVTVYLSKMIGKICVVDIINTSLSRSAKKLNLSHDKITKLFKELETNGLITRKMQGQG